MSDPNSIPASIFRAYDIRGKVGPELDNEVARKVGMALATMGLARGVRQVAVGRDGRESSPGLAAALSSGINSVGLDTLELGMVTSPLTYWAAHTRTQGSCAMVTGSHNPKEYNGIKMMLAGETLAAEDVQGLRALIVEDRCHANGGAGVAELDPGAGAAYAEALLGGRTLARPVKVVVDCGNGVTGKFADEWLRRLGCETITMFDEVDGDFPNHHPDPANPANFAAAAQALAVHDAELAIAFDGDGDRLGVWLPQGGLVYPDRLLMALARDLLARQAGAQVIFDVKCSANTAPFITAHGGTPLMVRTGHSFVKRELNARGAPLAGELSGHFFFNEGDWRFDDAMLAAVKLLELVAQAGSAEELFAAVPDSAASPETQVALDPQVDAHAFVASLADPANFPGVREIKEIDGVRAEWDDGFGLVRASNTTPSLVLRFEGKDAAARDRITTTFRELLRRADPRLRIGF